MCKVNNSRNQSMSLIIIDDLLLEMEWKNKLSIIMIVNVRSPRCVVSKNFKLKKNFLTK